MKLCLLGREKSKIEQGSSFEFEGQKQLSNSDQNQNPQMAVIDQKFAG